MFHFIEAKDTAWNNKYHHFPHSDCRHWYFVLRYHEHSTLPWTSPLKFVIDSDTNGFELDLLQPRKLLKPIGYWCMSWQLSVAMCSLINRTGVPLFRVAYFDKLWICSYFKSNDWHMLLVITFIEFTILVWQFDGLVQERRNSTANALELRISCTNPSN